MRSAVPKPAHLSAHYGDQFRDPSIVSAYGFRPTYPMETYDILLSLVAGGPFAAVLDVGAGRGEIARAMIGRVARVDAVEPSPAMVAAGRALPQGDHSALRWINDRAEEAALAPPYGLIAAGASLHWMEWNVVLPRFYSALSPDGVLAIVDVSESPYPWNEGLQYVIERFSTNRDFRPYNLVSELEQRGLFRTDGYRSTASVPLQRSVSEYVESFHARNGFSRDRMSITAAADFDASVTSLVASHAPGGTIISHIVGHVTWGHPMPNSEGALDG